MCVVRNLRGREKCNWKVRKNGEKGNDTKTEEKISRDRKKEEEE